MAGFECQIMTTGHDGTMKHDLFDVLDICGSELFGNFYVDNVYCGLPTLPKNQMKLIEDRVESLVISITLPRGILVMQYQPIIRPQSCDMFIGYSVDQKCPLVRTSKRQKNVVSALKTYSSCTTMHSFMLPAWHQVALTRL